MLLNYWNDFMIWNSWWSYSIILVSYIIPNCIKTIRYPISSHKLQTESSLQELNQHHHCGTYYNYCYYWICFVILCYAFPFHIMQLLLREMTVNQICLSFSSLKREMSSNAKRKKFFILKTIATNLVNCAVLRNVFKQCLLQIIEKYFNDEFSRRTLLQL